MIYINKGTSMEIRNLNTNPATDLTSRRENGTINKLILMLIA